LAAKASLSSAQRPPATSSTTQPSCMCWAFQCSITLDLTPAHASPRARAHTHMSCARALSHAHTHARTRTHGMRTHTFTDLYLAPCTLHHTIPADSQPITTCSSSSSRHHHQPGLGPDRHLRRGHPPWQGAAGGWRGKQRRRWGSRQAREP